MTPRNTQLGASAAARKAPARRGAGAAASARPRATSTKKPSGATSSRPARDASWFRWWLLPIFIAAAAAVFIVTYYPVARVQYRETRERARLQAEYDALTARNHRLATEVARLKTPEGVEDYARSQLGMVKAGEHVVIVTDATEKTPSTLTTAGTPPMLDSSGETTGGPSGPWTAFLDSVFRVQ